MATTRRALVSVRDESTELGAVVADESGRRMEGSASAVLGALVREIGEWDAIGLTLEEGWSNGYLYFADAVRE